MIEIGRYFQYFWSIGRLICNIARKLKRLKVVKIHRGFIEGEGSVKRSNEIGVLPVTLYGKCYATGEPIETDWLDKKREEEYIRKDKAISNDEEEEDEGKKEERIRERSLADEEGDEGKE